MIEEREYHWGNDPYWTKALDGYIQQRADGVGFLDINIQQLEEIVFSDPLAFKMAEAMASVIEHEGLDGHRGAPRLVLALLAKLTDLGVARSRQR